MALALTVSFYATDHYMAAQLLHGKVFWMPSLGWDRAIPFQPSWVWVYLLYFPACFLPVTFIEVLKNGNIFRRVAAGFILQFAFALAFFWLLPSQVHRPELQHAGISSQVLRWFYEVDPGYNVFPSLHVANVAYVACVAERLERRALSLGVWVLCLLIAASTLFIKQHYFIDLPAGILVGVLSHHAAFSKRMDFLDSRKTRAPAFIEASARKPLPAQAPAQ